jgi:ribosomal protein S18 acetylase RimI-like enzyme
VTGFTPLPWDTQFFGRRIAIASEPSYTAEAFAGMLRTAAAAGIECLYLLVDARDAALLRLAQEAGSHLADIRITFAQKLGEHTPYKQEATISVGPVREDQIDTLLKCSHDCFTNSRFYRDPHFTRAQCVALYEAWTEKSCRGWADTVLLAEHQQTPAGFVSCLMAADNQGKIGLICVNPAARGQGVGKQLMHAALDWFADRGADGVSVITQGSNALALRLYQECGFTITSVGLWFHKWFD